MPIGLRQRTHPDVDLMRIDAAMFENACTCVPKNAKAVDPLTKAPSEVAPEQLKELGIRILSESEFVALL